MASSTLIAPESAPASEHSPFVPGVQPPQPFTLASTCIPRENGGAGHRLHHRLN
jgi:hypothetical protein